MDRETKRYIDNKFNELYKMIAHSTKENWDYNQDNSDSIDEVLAEELREKSVIDNLDECVDEILIQMLK